jgi:hypothetical protein
MSSQGRSCSHAQSSIPTSAAAAALPATNNDRAAPDLEVTLGQRERFGDS